MIFSILFTSDVVVLIIIIGVLFFIRAVACIPAYLRPVRFCKKASEGKISYARELPPVSVIVYAQNDAEHLESFLPNILTQDYPEFEVIVINDGSTDHTKEVLMNLQKDNPHLYQTFIPEESRNLSRKKLALTLGVKAAKYDIVLLTDANCYPISSEWIKTMARNFVPGTEIVLGYGSYEDKKQRGESYRMLDMLYRAFRYFSCAIKGRPYMGSGVNLAYRKHLFFDNRGFSDHLNLHFGDDDLFVNKICTRTNTRVELSPESRMIEVFYNNRQAWKEQKLRYDFTSRFLKHSPRFFYRFDWFTRYLFFAVVGFSVYKGFENPLFWIVAGAAVLLRYIVQLIMGYRIKKYFPIKNIPVAIVMFDLFQPIVDVYFHFVGMLNKKRNYTWKKK